MKTKSEITTNFILEKAAPVFNKKGYKATSMADLTKATGLTKGAIYGNFESKEDIAIKVFYYNVNRVLTPLKNTLLTKDNTIDKLFLLTDFYRNYYQLVLDYGGCPILNVATDSKNVNPKLYQASCKITKELENWLTNLIQKGIEKSEVQNNINPQVTARNIYSMIEGSIFMSITHQDKMYILEMMNHLDIFINEKLKK